MHLRSPKHINLRGVRIDCVLINREYIQLTRLHSSYENLLPKKNDFQNFQTPRGNKHKQKKSRSLRANPYGNGL